MSLTYWLCLSYSNLISSEVILLIGISKEQTYNVEMPFGV